MATRSNNSMMARVQRQADKVYNKKCEQWYKKMEVSDGKKSLGKIEIGEKIDDFPVRKITKFFSRG